MDKQDKLSNEQDSFIEQALTNIRGKMVFCEFKRLIKEHLSFHGRTDDKDWLQASIKHYLENGNPSGSFYQAIEKIAHQYAAFVLEQPLLNKYKNQSLLNKEQGVQASVASKAEATTEAGNKTPLISKGGAEEVEKLAEDILDKHFPHSWYTPVYPKKSKPIHDNECRRCKDDDSLLAAMIEMYNQALTQKAGDGWKERLSADDFLKDPSQNTYHSLWDKKLGDIFG